MSYFNTLNEYLQNANEAKAHLDDFKDSIVSSKVGDIKDKYDQAIDKIENYGQAIVGASSAYHLGRKVYKKIKKGNDPSKDEKEEKKPEEGEEAEAPEEQAPITEANSTEFTNPAFSKSDTSEPTEAGNEIEPTEDIASEPVTSADIPAGSGGASGGSAGSGTIEVDESTDISGLGQSQAPLSEEQASAFTRDPVNSQSFESGGTAETSFDAPASRPSAVDSALPNSGELDGVNSMAETGSKLLEDAGESTAKNFLENSGKKLAVKAGEKIAEKVGFDAVGAIADAVPVIGEIAGVAQIFHGLFKENKMRAKEAKAETKASTGIRIAGNVAQGGVDLSALAGGYAPITGLV